MNLLKSLALIAALAGVVLAGCETLPQSAGRVGGREPERGRGGFDPRRPDPGGPPPSPQRCDPRRLVGVLVVFSNVVLVNNQAARTGQLVCDGDAVRTDARGSADVVPEQDRESDSIHLAENTDPRFSWLRGSGCLQIDRYARGKIITTTRRLCMVVRTADTLMLQTAGRTQFTVVSAARTEVVPISGRAVKLKPLSEGQIQALPRVRLETERADSKLQPLPRHLNVYSGNTVLQKSPLPQRDIDAIQRSRIRAPIDRLPSPTPAPVPR